MNDQKLNPHMLRVAAIRQELIEWNSQNKQGLSKNAHHSNVMRAKEYKKFSPHLSLSSLSHVLQIDVANQRALVEPSVTMEQLVKATLEFDLIPPVVPEFKGITVGGAIMGAALESSSYLFGQFNDCCLAYVMLLGDGSIVTASPTENSDLFYGVSGSYGSLGILLAIEMRLIPAQPYVHVQYQTFSKIEEAVAAIQKETTSKSADFVEAIVFDKTKTTLISGKMCSQELLPKKLPKFSMRSYWSLWFYQHVRKTKTFYEEAIPLYDYLFRHDRGAFWMGGYGLHSKLLTEYLTHKAAYYLPSLKSFISTQSSNSYFSPKDPHLFFRYLLGWCMNSQKLYGSLHHGSEKWFEERFVIQDFYLPISTCESFIETALNLYGVTPLWLCPIKSTHTPQIFAPHQLKTHELLLDIGIYGYPFSSQKRQTIVKELENLALNLQGRKMFYAYSYFSDDEFWNYYSQSDYLKLRKKYHAENVWPDMTLKVLSKLN